MKTRARNGFDTESGCPVAEKRTAKREKHLLTALYTRVRYPARPLSAKFNKRRTVVPFETGTESGIVKLERVEIMIFSGIRFQQVLDGVKTQTRRPVKSDHAQSLINGSIKEIDPKKSKLRLKYSVGKTYAVCPGRGKRGQGFIQIDNIRWQTVGQISDDDAVLEGMENREQFFDVWRELYGGIDPLQFVWVIDFHLVKVDEEIPPKNALRECPVCNKYAITGIDAICTKCWRSGRRVPVA